VKALKDNEPQASKLKRFSSEGVKDPSEGEGTESKAMAEDNAGKSLPRKPRLLPTPAGDTGSEQDSG